LPAVHGFGLPAITVHFPVTIIVIRKENKVRMVTIRQQKLRKT